ncbi:MAG: hypothetical protein AAFO29_13020 [Actinomycetota bacterium]
MSSVAGPNPTSVRLTWVGLVMVVVGYVVVPWGDGQTFLGLRGDVFGERWPEADFNRQLQEAFGIWGFAVLMLVAAVAVVAVRRTAGPVVLGPLVALLLGGAIWHQGMIGTVFGLNLFSHLPQLGAVISAAGVVGAMMAEPTNSPDRTPAA